MSKDIFFWTIKLETTLVNPVVAAPFALKADTLAPTMTAAYPVGLSEPVLPVSVISRTSWSMVVWVLPPLALSTPDKAAKIAP